MTNHIEWRNRTMTTRKVALVAAILASVVSGAAFAAQIPYAIFTGGGGVSNLTWLTPEGTGCTADCDGDPVYGGHGYTYGAANDVAFIWDGTVFTSSTDYTGPGSAG